jgi:predicted permease
MTTIWYDIRYGFRQLGKSPGFTAIALVTLAIGIGANTVMFSLVDMLILQSPQVKRINELAVCQAENADWHFPYEAYVEFRTNNPVFTDVAGQGGLPSGKAWALPGQQENPKQFGAISVSYNYFSVLGAVPLHGRWFLPEEERYGAEPVVVLSYQAFKDIGGDPERVGTEILLNGESFRIVGVTRKGFTGASLIGPDIWLPLGCGGLPASETMGRPARPYPAVIPLGRLKPGIDLASAQSQLQVLVPRLRENYPAWWEKPGNLALSSPGRMYLVTAEGPGNEHRFYSILGMCLMAVSGVVLLIACLNLAGMLIVQGTSRQREIAIRIAIGGGRLRIMRQLLSESLLMSLVGGALGCVLALICIRALNSWIAATPLMEIPAELVAKLNGRVLLGTLGFCVLATILFGLKPAWQLTQRDVMSDLKESARDALRSARKRRGAHRESYLIAQTALSVVLVMGAALFTRSAMKVGDIVSGFDFQGKLIMEGNLEAAVTNSTTDRQACMDLVERLEALPGVESVATSRSCNFVMGWPAGPVYEYHPGDEQLKHRPQVVASSIHYSVGLKYFKTMGIRLLQGRSFRALDCVAGAEKVMIIDEQLARKLRPNGNALGCLIQYGPGKYYEKIKPHRVVGIVQTLYTPIEKKRGFKIQMYGPTSERAVPVHVHVLGRNRTPKGQEALMRIVSQTVHSVDSPMRTSTIQTLRERYNSDEFVWLTGVSARLALTFGAMALFLASLGIYAIKMYMVASRTPEIGIRMALGAMRKDVILMVLREGMLLTLAGLIAGLLLALAIGRLIGNQLYGISPIDPVSIGVTVILLGAASLLASYIPARRAAKIDPMEALRYE